MMFNLHKLQNNNAMYIFMGLEFFTVADTAGYGHTHMKEICRERHKYST